MFITSLLLLLASAPASAVEHPGIVHKDDLCSSCHADKISGKSVHSAMATPCTVCHVAQTQGDMTTMNLAMPKERICFACHEKSTESQRHSPAVKGLCVDCHDAHSSDRRLLLRQQADDSRSSEMPPSRRERE
jgi:predicted CXXCH cytochrome family protein